MRKDWTILIRHGAKGHLTKQTATTSQNHFLRGLDKPHINKLH